MLANRLEKGILRYMNRGEFQEAWVGAMQEMHKEGQEWLFTLDVAQRVTARDEGYMRCYRQINRVLSVIGVERPDEPRKIASPGKIYPTLMRLERSGLVESKWQYPDTPDGEHGRRQYRLVPQPQETPVPPIAE